MEWTLPHKNSDSRGNRRYFTLASSPTEDVLRISVKFNNPSSSFKTAMLGRGQIVAGNRAGSFTLPKDVDEKLVFMAGGIGITPFRSMIKYLLDKGEKRDVVLMYSNKKAEDTAYKDFFDQAGITSLKTIYTITDTENVPPTWTGKVGRIDANTILKEIPDYKERRFYISGPHVMVEAFKQTLAGLGVEKSKIKEDFFPGYV
jgi:ferredoxin-NADP reductase